MPEENQVQIKGCTEFKREVQAYRAMEKSLLKNYNGKWVAIYNGQLIAVADTRMEAIEKARQKAGPVRAYIRCVGKKIPQIRLPRNRRCLA
ncbi:hypothetical protein CL633_02455 [bacterium]|nr:hypothetical protein [bacterium]|tara:strand:- start:1189 stop:1461 length:273 start_codon:yes stop_codon:yes gene_type:complete